jgi:hypothetical protein
MHKSFLFITPIHIKGLEMPRLSPEMMYLMTTDVELKGKEAILRQLSRLFEIDLEELLHPPLDQEPVITMNYDLFEDDWEYIGDRSDKKLLEHTFHLAKSMQTGETDDETEALMRREGWSSTKDIKEETEKMLHLITTYPFFWRAIKYQDQSWLKPYFEQTKPELSSEEKIVSAFTLDVQELVHFITQLNQQKQLWFAKCLLN